MDDKIRIKRLCISDVHLGGGFSRIKGLIDFLDKYDFEELILCGDILDLWRMKSKVIWRHKQYTPLIDKVLDIASEKKVIYIPGNHDDYFRRFIGCKFFNIRIEEEYRADDILFIHGDVFDNLSEEQQVIYHLGDVAYTVIQRVNQFTKWPLSFILRDPFAPSKFFKQLGKRIFSHLNGFYRNAAIYTWRRGCGKVICGHTHIAEYRIIDILDIRYYNCGDWVESGTAIIQYNTGELEIIDYDLQNAPVEC